MFLSRVPSQGGVDSAAVTAPHAPRLHNATLRRNSGLLWPLVPGRSRKMSPQNLLAGPEGGHYLVVLAVWQELTYHKGPHIPNVGVGSFVDPRQQNGQESPRVLPCLTLLMISLWHQSWAHPHCSLLRAVRILRALSKCLLKDFVSIRM